MDVTDSYWEFFSLFFVLSSILLSERLGCTYRFSIKTKRVEDRQSLPHSIHPESDISYWAMNPMQSDHPSQLGTVYIIFSIPFL